MIETLATADTTEVKSCCARIYESDSVKLLLGDSFHPGGVKLTTRLGEVLRLTPQSCVLEAIKQGKLGYAVVAGGRD